MQRGLVYCAFQLHENSEHPNWLFPFFAAVNQNSVHNQQTWLTETHSVAQNPPITAQEGDQPFELLKTALNELL